MTGLTFQIMLIAGGFYLLFCYPFFLIPYAAYLFQNHPAHAKLKRTVTFLLTPFLLPFLLLWGVVSLAASVALLFLFTWVALLVWVSNRFPLGKVFQTWFRWANWVFDKIERVLPFFAPAQPARTAAEMKPLQANAVTR